MTEFLEKIVARSWNRRLSQEKMKLISRNELDLGAQVNDGEPTQMRVGIAQNRRAEHLVLLGKTGTGKSYLIRYCAQQDVFAGRGFAFFDLHGDVTPFLLNTIAMRERVLKRDLSDRLIVIDPADPEYSVGLNPLEDPNGNDRFVQIAEFAQILKERWRLDSFGPRTDELLRNTLFAIAETGLTLIEVGPFLGDADFRSRCLPKITNPEVREYFEGRYNEVSEAMRRVMAEPVLNKISQFISDVRFRHLLGQQRSTFSLLRAIDSGCWILLKLDKGRLGEQAATFGSLFLAKLKHAFFSRTDHNLFTLFLDEVQNLVTYGGGLETMLAEIRKRAGAIVTANQFLAQHPPEIQAALLSVGSFGFFQLSGSDAQHIATMLDGGKALGERLKNLPRRHLVAKAINERWREAIVPVVEEPKIESSDLYRRSRLRWARPRHVIEEEIRNRRGVARRMEGEALDDWE